MRYIALVVISLLIASCNIVKKNTDEIAQQKEVYKSWVLSRCLSKGLTDSVSQQDALNSASAYLEQSLLPVESLTNAEPLINKFLAKDYQGSITGSFNTKKCIDLFYSKELEDVFVKSIN